MQRSTLAIVAAILASGSMIAGAILLSASPEPLLHTAPPDPFADVKAAVANQMFDPQSATFQGVFTLVDGMMYCGMVNGKNRMGGYVGYQQFFAQKASSGEWIVALDRQIPEVMCEK